MSLTCDDCLAVLSSKGHLFRHNKGSIHQPHFSAPKNLACDDCGYTATRPNHILQHCIKWHWTTQRRLSCDVCDEQWYRKEGLYHHYLRVHKPVEAYICDDCGCSLPGRNYFPRHIRDGHSQTWAKNAFVCDDCGIILSSHNAAVLHSSRVHKTCVNKNFQCDDCWRTGFSRREHLFAHVSGIHSKALSELFHCDDCKRVLNYKSNLVHHTEWAHLRIHAVKSAICDDCETVISCYSNLREHIRNVHQKAAASKCTCDDCNILVRRDHILYHIRAFHLLRNQKNKAEEICNTNCEECDHIIRRRHSVSEKNARTEKDANVLCDSCKKTRDSINFINSPKYVADKNNTISRKKKRTLPTVKICDQCSKDMKRQIYFVAHIFKIHFENTTAALKMRLAKDARFVCSDCGKAVQSKMALEFHMSRAHDVKGKLAIEMYRRIALRSTTRNCDDCGKYTGTSPATEQLWRHFIRLHSSSKMSHKVTCDQCNRTFVSKTALTKHAHSHFSDTPFSFCDDCGAKYILKSILGGLTGHILLVHNPENPDAQILKQRLELKRSQQRIDDRITRKRKRNSRDIPKSRHSNAKVSTTPFSFCDNCGAKYSLKCRLGGLTGHILLVHNPDNPDAISLAQEQEQRRLRWNQIRVQKRTQTVD